MTKSLKLRVGGKKAQATLNATNLRLASSNQPHVPHRLCGDVDPFPETVARISSERLDERLPEPVGHDEISRLAKTFNHMLERIQTGLPL